MRLIVGLGNPGDKYKNNRHNVGFLILDEIASAQMQSFKKQKNFDYIEHKGVILMKPKTYMNLSGNAVTAVKTKHRIDDILVIVDDIYLPLGEIRLRNSGGLAGHNGLKSIAKSLGTNDFKRMRIGINSPNEKNLADYVLSNFSKEEKEKLDITFAFSQELLEQYIQFDFDEMVKYYSRNKKSYSEKIVHTQDRSAEQ